MEGSVSGFLGMIVLNSHNYSVWKIKMENLLIVTDLYEPIDRKDIPTGVMESECKTLNIKVVATIRQCIDISILQHVVSDTNTLNKTSLMRKIVRLKYKW